MKPYQLLATLMEKEGLNPTSLARLVGKPKMQPQFHRFIHGQVAHPSPATVAPLAAHFKLPLEAFYDEKVATAVARERNIEKDALAIKPAPQQEGRHEPDDAPEPQSQPKRSSAQERWRYAADRIADYCARMDITMAPAEFLLLIDTAAKFLNDRASEREAAAIFEDLWPLIKRGSRHAN